MSFNNPWLDCGNGFLYGYDLTLELITCKQCVNNGYCSSDDSYAGQTQIYTLFWLKRAHQLALHTGDKAVTKCLSMSWLIKRCESWHRLYERAARYDRLRSTVIWSSPGQQWHLLPVWTITIYNCKTYGKFVYFWYSLWRMSNENSVWHSNVLQWLTLKWGELYRYLHRKENTVLPSSL